MVLTKISLIKHWVWSGFKLFDTLMVFLNEFFEKVDFVCLFDLNLYVPSTIFQLYRDGSFWVEPVLMQDKCVLLKDHNTVTPVRLEPAALRYWVKHSTTELLRSHPPPLPKKKKKKKSWFWKKKTKQEMSQTRDECPQRNWSSIRHIWRK